MDFRQLVAAFQNLNETERHVMHVLTTAGSASGVSNIERFSKAASWADSKQRPLKENSLRPVLKKLESQGLLKKASQGYEYYTVPEDLQDYVIQDCVRTGWFAKYVDSSIPIASYSYSYHGGAYEIRELRKAFYTGDVQSFKRCFRGKIARDAGLLTPFSRSIYDHLPQGIQLLFLEGMVQQQIMGISVSREALQIYDDLNKQASGPEGLNLACNLDLAIARGDLASLKQLNESTKSKFPEIEGCYAFLKGDFKKASQLFAKAMPLGEKKGRKSSLAMERLPALLYLLVLFRENSHEATQMGYALIAAGIKGDKNVYADVLTVFEVALKFQELPTDSAQLNRSLTGYRRSPLETLISSYFQRWLLTDNKDTGKKGYLSSVARGYQTSGLHWLAAEARTLFQSEESETSDGNESQHPKDTISLVNWIEPEPAWQRSLNAIALIGGNRTTEQAKPERSTTTDRLIWEISKGNELELVPFHQKLTSKGWSAGKRVSLARLRTDFTSSEYAFLAVHDQALCRAIILKTYGGRYPETICYVDPVLAAKALIGHPCVYYTGDRQTPLEVVEQPPRLIVSKSKNKTVRLSLEPKLPDTDGDDDDEDERLSIVKDGPHRIQIVIFTSQHLRLGEILGKSLEVPAASADRVIKAVQAISSIVAVHSEIGGDMPSAESTPGDPRLHVHLLPLQTGLRLELFVRPFGDDGPFSRPGKGGVNVFATLDGKPRSACRDLAEEKRRVADLLERCSLLSDIDGETDDFPTPLEALEMLLELDEYNASHDNALVLHWPQGKSMTLAGQATASNFQVQIRKDRDWFAASGSLKVDRDLSIDMLKLIDLVEASPSRFVQLDDGRFLALTDQLRKRIEDFSQFGERQKNKLRFPAVRAAAFEDMGDLEIKSDEHWKECVQRMRSAADVQPALPSTLQTELRDYQHEGFNWLARLAAWGVGGCLADDMGLGKTIQALTLLLHRAPGGPALVIAPTSVAFNWQNEAARFAPTLNTRLFGSGDRDASFENLGPRDVVIASYGMLHTEVERFQAQAWHTIILDEAQAIKNTATRRSQAAMGLEADFRLIMTGTPLENHLGELWNLFQFINPGLLGSLEVFQRRFAVPIERDHCAESRRRLKKLIQPFLLRRTKTQVLSELPSRTEQTLMVEMSKEEAAFYEALRIRAVEKLADTTNAGGRQHLKILAEIMRLRRACCHPKLAMEDCGLPSAKLALFSETIDELLENRHKALVFSQFVDHLTILREELDRKQISYQYLDGSTSAAERKKRVEAFQSGEGDVFLISLKAGGLGLNLTAADYVLHMDPWWNPAVEDQASDRAHRMGQLRPVTIYRFITAGTIEERISEMHAAKRDLADSLLEGTDVSGKLTAEQLLTLIRD